MSAVVSSSAIVYGGVEMGQNVYIGQGSVIYPGVKIGDGVRIECNAVIGSPPELKGFMRGEKSRSVVVGDDCTIRNCVTIDAGAYGDTIIGKGCTLLNHSHVGHDAVLEDDVMISCGVKVGGHCYIGAHANIGLNAVIHQKQIIGAGAMIGMGACITKRAKVEPFTMFAGVPARQIGINTKLIHQFDEDKILWYKKRYDILRNDSGL